MRKGKEGKTHFALKINSKWQVKQLQLHPSYNSYLYLLYSNKSYLP